MEKNQSLFETFVNYAVDTNKQAYEFGNRMVHGHLEFSRNVAKMMPGMDAWAQFVPASNKK